MRILCTSAVFLCLPFLGHADILGFQYTQIDYPGMQNTLGYGINDSGEITGYYFDPVQTNGGDRGFTYKNGVWTTYQVGSYYSTDLYGVNNAGNLVGSYNNQDFSVDQGIFVPAGGSPQNFSPPSSTQSENYGINNNGQVVGSTFTTASPSGGYVFDGTTTIPINCPAGSALPHGINDSGAIVGFCEVRVQNSSSYSGFLTSISSPNTLTPIGIAGALDNWAYGINNAGLIVGVTRNSLGNDQGFLLDNGMYQFIDFPGAVNTYVAGINNEDQIVGWFEDSHQHYHAFVASPVPEPASWVLMLLPLGLLVRRFRALSRRSS